MKWSAKADFLQPLSFNIVHDPNVGFYLYVFENNVCIQDHLQDSFQIATESALEYFDVPTDIWVMDTAAIKSD